MVTPTDPDVPAVAQALLELCVTALGAGVPARRYRSAGLPVWDFVGPGCDSQLTVTLGPVTIWPGPISAAAPEYSPNRLRTYLFVVELARAVPTQKGNGAAPTAADLDAAGAQYCADFFALDRWKRSLGWSSKGIPPELTTLGVLQVVDSTVTGVQPQGGMVGVRATILLAM